MCLFTGKHVSVGCCVSSLRSQLRVLPTTVYCRADSNRQCVPVAGTHVTRALLLRRCVLWRVCHAPIRPCRTCHLSPPVVHAQRSVHQDSTAQVPRPRFSAVFLVTYFARWAFASLLIEAMLHHVPVFAVIRSGLYRTWDSVDVSLLGYTTLNVMWLKFLVSSVSMWPATGVPGGL